MNNESDNNKFNRKGKKIPKKHDIIKFLKKYCDKTDINIYSSDYQMQITRKMYNDIIHMLWVKKKKDITTLPIRNANSFLKSIMFTRYIPKKKVIMNLGGHGQDIYKLEYCKPEAVMFINISEYCLFEAENRWRKCKYPFPATFIQDDFCTKDFLLYKKLTFYEEDSNRMSGEQRTPIVSKHLYTKDGKNIVGAISCQFTAHYAFYSRDSAERFLDNISRVLQPQGVFLGIAPQGEKILSIINTLLDGKKYRQKKYAVWLDKNELPKINKTSDNNEEDTKLNLQGSHIAYWFWMKNMIECKQYTMTFQDLKEMCEKRGLNLIYMSNCKDAYHNEIINPKNKPLMERMGVDANTLSDADKDQLGLYCSFAFVKTEK
jgi:hypothetical protein